MKKLISIKNTIHYTHTLRNRVLFAMMSLLMIQITETAQLDIQKPQVASDQALTSADTIAQTAAAITNADQRDKTVAALVQDAVQGSQKNEQASTTTEAIKAVAQVVPDKDKAQTVTVAMQAAVNTANTQEKNQVALEGTKAAIAVAPGSVATVVEAAVKATNISDNAQTGSTQEALIKQIVQAAVDASTDDKKAETQEVAMRAAEKAQKNLTAITPIKSGDMSTQKSV